MAYQHQLSRGPKDGQEIPIGGRYTVQDDDSLLISEADEIDNARYTCTANNFAGKDSASTVVQVVGKYSSYKHHKAFNFFLFDN